MMGVCVRNMSSYRNFIKLHCCIKLAFHFISWWRCTVINPQISKDLGALTFRVNIFSVDWLTLEDEGIRSFDSQEPLAEGSSTIFQNVWSLKTSVTWCQCCLFCLCISGAGIISLLRQRVSRLCQRWYGKGCLANQVLRGQRFRYAYCAVILQELGTLR